jgi:hypothetical protein
MVTMHGASQQIWMTDVCFGSKADIARDRLNVRFTPKSGHWQTTVGCPLCADFVAEVGGDTRVAVVANFLK